MDYSKSVRAFAASFPVRNLNGREKFLIVAAYCAKGDTSTEVAIKDIMTGWPVSTLRCAYNSAHYHRADEAGWVARTKNATLRVTQDGIEHLTAIAGGNNAATASTTNGLRVFDTKQTHDFDKFLRGVFSSATTSISIADAYVDDTIFDNLLDQIPPSAEIRLIHNKKQGSFDARVARFTTQYAKFQTKAYAELHDRFLIVDGQGYVIGPSLKDAARKSPALVVSLGGTDSTRLQKFFDELWKRST